MQKCPFCQEEIQNTAIKCRYCGEWLNKQDEISSSYNDTVDKISSPPNTPQQQSKIIETSIEQFNEQQIIYSGFWKRVAAHIVDTIISVIVLFGVIIWFGMMFGGGILDTKVWERMGSFLGLFGVWLYYALMESSSYQGTVGKMFGGIKVTDLNGQKISFARATGRHFGMYLSSFIFCIGFIMVAFTRKKQGLHDIMSGCLVVNRWPEFSGKEDIKIEKTIRDAETKPSEKVESDSTYNSTSEIKHNDEEFIELLKSSINENGLNNIPGKELLEIYHRAKLIDASSNTLDIELSKAINTLSDELKKRGLLPDVQPQEKSRFEESSSLAKEEEKAATAKVVIAIIIVVAIALVFLFLNNIRSNSPNQRQSNYTASETKETLQELTAEEWVNKAIALMEDGSTDPNKAIEYSNNAIKLASGYYKAYVVRGSAYGRLGQYQYAIEDCNEAIRLKPDYAPAYFNRGVAYSKLGNYNQEIADYNKAIELNPNKDIVYFNRGVAYGNLGNYNQEIADYNKVIELNPRDAEAYYNRALSYKQLGNYDQAISDISKAIDLNPNDADAYRNRGSVYLLQKNEKMGCPDIKKSCELGNCKALNLAKKNGFCRQ